MKKLILLLTCIALYNGLWAQGGCAGVNFTPIAQYPIALGSNYSFSSFLIGGGDFDSDGKEDLVFIGASKIGYKTTLILQRNIRTGTLPSQVGFDTSIGIYQTSGQIDFVVNDFNNDGKPDIALVYGDSVEILINHSTTGSFAFYKMPLFGLPYGEAYTTLKSGDYDGDHKQDLMLEGTDKQLYVILNTGYTSTTATFGTPIATGVHFSSGIGGTYSWHSYDAVDMNNDSLPDMAYASPNSDTVFVYQNKSTVGSIKFTLAQRFRTPDSMVTSQFWDGRHLQIRDLNGDGLADIGILYGPSTKPYANYYHRQKLIFLKNVTSGVNIKVAFSDTLGLNKFVKPPYNYLLDDTGGTMHNDSSIEFSDFSFVNNDPCKLRPDILLSVEGCCPQPYSNISYHANTSTLSKISYSPPCWYKHFTSDRAGVGQFCGTGKDDLLSMCDICLSSSPGYGLSILENVSTIKLNNQTVAFDTVSVQCKANRVGGMKIKLYLPCHILKNMAKDSVVIAWSPKISTSDTATLVFGAKYSVHIYNQSKKYDTTITLSFANPYHVGQNGVPIKVTFNDTTICPGAPIQLIVAKSNKVNHYLWTPNTAINNDTLASPTVNPTATTVYHVTGSGGECLRDTFVTVNVHPIPVIIASPLDTGICPGQPVVLTAYGAKVYSWAPPRHLSNDSGNITVARVDSATTYTVDGFDGKCNGYASVTINTIAAPTVHAGRNWTLHTNESYTINDAFVIGDYFRYWWVPALYMNDSTLLNPTVYSPVSMWYHLFAINAYGCGSEDSMYIKFDPMGHIFVPDAFTPNKDGVNDYLIVQKENIRTFHMEIYNRWGQEVFITDSPLASWDGRFNGEPEPVGSYVYFIQATDIGGHPLDMKGNITLLR